ncbi:response regulator transcription factor [Paenibacillus guangzhouensis]|uniref:response regulator transcription factor n=1 Tax=Paenibacillus guangzhouensis TaxID=1473112 RepID=UPI001267088A|nr:response regulator [Paenibacillus guangzhouensis]
MRKLLIVDDEKNIRLGLKSMIEREFADQYSFYFAGDGEEALRIAQEEQVEILITDIRMPVMDGIELIHQVRDVMKHLAVVILSGYDDFQYAKEAIRCEVKEYLLKPIVRQELFQVLTRLESELNQRQVIADQLTHAMQLMDDYKSVQLNYVLMHEELTAADMRERLSKAGLDWLDHGYYVGIMKMTASGQPDHCVPYGCKIDDALEDAGGMNCIRVNDKNGRMVIIAEQRDMLYRMTNQLSCEPFFAYRMGISEAMIGMEQIRQGYAEACKALCYYLLQPCCGAIEYGTIRGREANYHLPIDDLKKIANMLGTGREAEMMRLLLHVFHTKDIARYDICYLEGLSRSLNELVFDKVFEVYGDASIEILKLYRWVGNIYNFDTFHDYIHNVKSLLLRLNDYVGQVRSVHHEQKEMHHALQYIHDHYHQDLNMAMVSNHVSLNYSYFSQAFKEYTGETFVSYLRKLRIERSKELLGRTDFKVYEISTQVGFENVKHFTRVFREIEGVSPLEYRTQQEILERR